MKGLVALNARPHFLSSTVIWHSCPDRFAVTLTIRQAAGRREECDFRRTTHGNPIPDLSLSLPQPPAENQDRRGIAKPRSMRELEASAALMVCFYPAPAGGADYTVAANEAAPTLPPLKSEHFKPCQEKDLAYCLNDGECFVIETLSGPHKHCR
ncbi:hypothetical protein SRHO_G00035950 [Serrasalmus rhombeus]